MATTLRMSQEEFDRRPGSDLREEYVHGEVITLAPETLDSEQIRWFLGDLMRWCARAHGGEVVGPSYLVRLRKGLRRIPELLYVAPARMNLMEETYLDGPPDLAVEIVSAESVDRDWRDKFLEYQEAGVREYAVADPLYRRFVLYGRAADGRFQEQEPVDGWLTSEVLPGLRLRPEWLWQRPLPDLADTLRELGLL